MQRLQYGHACLRGTDHDSGRTNEQHVLLTFFGQPYPAFPVWKYARFKLHAVHHILLNAASSAEEKMCWGLHAPHPY